MANKKKVAIVAILTAGALIAALRIGRIVHSLLDMPGVNVEQKTMQEVEEVNDYLLQQFKLNPEAEAQVIKKMPGEYMEYSDRVSSINAHLNNAKQEYIKYGVAEQMFREQFSGILAAYKATKKIDVPERQRKAFLSLCEQQIDALEKANRELELAHHELINLKGDYEGRIQNLAKVFMPFAKAILKLKQGAKKKAEHVNTLKTLFCEVIAAEEKETKEIFAQLEQEFKKK